MKKFKQFITEEDTELKIQDLQDDEYYEVITWTRYVPYVDSGFVVLKSEYCDLELNADKPIIFKTYPHDINHPNWFNIVLLNHVELERDILTPNCEGPWPYTVVEGKRHWMVYFNNSLRFRKADQNDPTVMQDLF